MLIVVSGVETIHKKFFARSILMKLTSVIDLGDGYTLNFSSHPFEIYDASGKLVYGTGTDTREGTNELLIDLDNDGIADPEGREIFDKAQELYNKYFLDGIRDHHFMNTFSDPWFDFGFVKVIDAPMDGNDVNYDLIHPHSYDDILAAYNARELDVHIITGSFSKHFIESIREDLGEENVQVYNITRNPSAAFLLNEKEPEFYTLKKPTKSRDRAMDRRKLEQSIINAMILKDVPGVTTVKYEDILASGKFTVNGIEITAPESLLEGNNGYLTTWDLTTQVPLGIVNADDIEEFNDHFLNYEPTSIKFDTDGVTLKLIKLADELKTPPLGSYSAEEIDKIFPKNIFDNLDYTPVTFSELTKAI
jgi:hypothetical protein